MSPPRGRAHEHPHSPRLKRCAIDSRTAATRLPRFRLNQADQSRIRGGSSAGNEGDRGDRFADEVASVGPATTGPGKSAANQAAAMRPDIRMRTDANFDRVSGILVPRQDPRQPVVLVISSRI
jgi:hypothetical protein